MSLRGFMSLTEVETRECRSHPSTKEILDELKGIRQLKLEKILYIDSVDVDAAIGMVRGIDLSIEYLEGVKDE